LSVGPGDVILIKSTRVPLETAIETFLDGGTAEEIVQRYPSITLTDAYSVIAYYLRHRHEVDDYLARRASERAQTRTEVEARFPTREWRERLLARRRGESS
jgi:uncharacterized protein (DUF433 family)